MESNNQLFANYRDFTNSKNSTKSNTTKRNYLSDVGQFITWCNDNGINLEYVNSSVILDYKKFLSDNISLTSRDRHFSSLRNFFKYLENNNLIKRNPVAVSKTNPESDTFKINDFCYFLEKEGASPLTVKNYRLDVLQFINWYKIVTSYETNPNNDISLLSTLNSNVLKTYSERLKDNLDLSDSSISRKLVSVRKYIEILTKKKLIDQNISKVNFVSNNSDFPDLSQKAYESQLIKANVIQKETEYLESLTLLGIINSKSGALTKAVLFNRYFIENFVTVPIESILSLTDYVFWRISKKSLFIPKSETDTEILTNIDRKLLEGRVPDFYSPIVYRLRNYTPLYSLYILIFKKRPNWYIRYHHHKIVHYIHFGILLTVAGLMGNYAYTQITNPIRQESVLGTQVQRQEDRSLLYAGTLVDKNNKPITSSTGMEFNIYDSNNDTDNTTLWTEDQSITPDTNGTFTVKVGSVNPIPSSLFSNGSPIYLGVKVADGEELKPRQQIPNVSLSEDSQAVSGMQPITEVDSNKNVLLALDSSGNLTIGPSGSTTFQTIGGSFTISGENVILSSSRFSNGDIILQPDGTGSILVNGPLRNTSDYGRIPQSQGTVEVDDSLSVFSTSSAIPALSIYQNGRGAILSASSGSELRFSVDNSGEGFLSGGLELKSGNLSTKSYSANVFNRFANLLNIGSDAISVNIGSTSGTTIIRNATLTVRGNQDIGGTNGTIYTGNNAGISFSGSGQHNIRAVSGTLGLDSLLEVNKDVDIIPQTKDGTNDLGSIDRPFDNLYVDNIITSSINSQFPNWTSTNGFIYPLSNTDSLAIGGTNDTNSGWVVYGQGTNSGSVMQTGDLTFKSGNTSINQLDGGSIIFKTSPNTSTNLDAKLIITNDGKLGLNNNTPDFLLDVIDDKSSTLAAMIQNKSTSTNADVLGLKVGNSNPDTNNNFITFHNGNGEVIGKITGNGAQGVTYSTTGSDFAEYFRKHSKDESFTTGDLVCLHSEGGVTRCDNTNTIIVGAVTDRAGFVGGSNNKNDDNYILVGINGQIPVRVDSLNIKESDPLTVSNSLGVASIAGNSSYIVGRVLEKPTQKNGITTALVYVKPGWYQQNKINLTDNGDLQITLQSNNDTPSSNTAQESEPLIFNDFINSFKTLLINSGNFFKNELIPISKKNFSYIENLASDYLIANNIISNRIVSPIVQSDVIQANILSPLSDDSSISMLLNPNNIAIKNTKTNRDVAYIDSSGNASFSGNLVADTGKFNEVQAENASISGTLRVDRLIASQIDGLATGSTVINNYYVSSSSSNLSNNQSNYTGNAQSGPLASGSLVTEFDDIATSSSGFDDLALDYDFITFRKGLISYGPSSLSDVAIEGLLSFNGRLLISDNTINTTEDVLFIQNLRNAGINILNGLITIDTSGNLKVEGNAIFAKDVEVRGGLSANIIRPIPNQDLKFSLSDSGKDSIIVEGATDSAVLKVNNSGDIYSSGSGNFLSLFTKDFKLVRNAQADTSDTVTVASSSAGTARILRGQTQRTIKTPLVSEDSLIYISPTSDTFGLSPYLSQQLPTLYKQVNGSKEVNEIGQFTIKITSPAPQNINLNWWIIN